MQNKIFNRNPDTQYEEHPVRVKRQTLKRLCVMLIPAALLLLFGLKICGVVFSESLSDASHIPTASTSSARATERSNSKSDTASVSASADEGQRKPTPAETTATDIPDTDYLLVSFIDVGQGDCTLVRTADGHTAMIDTGAYETGELLVAYLKSIGVESLDLLILTHAHYDHIGAADIILENFPTSQVMLSNTAVDEYWYTKTLDTAAETGTGIIYPAAGMTAFIGDASFMVLSCEDSTGMTSDSSGFETDGLNLSSIVIRLSYGDVDFMLTGDAEVVNEYAILERGYPVEAEVMKAGHHGSNTSNSEDFISAVSPDIVIYTVAEDNGYSLPSSRVLTYYRRHGAAEYRTSVDGTITVTTDGNTYAITCCQTNTR